MVKTATKTDPKLRNEVKAEVTTEGKGGKPGQWSARKAQLATQEYKKEGGGYEGAKSPDNHLTEWTREDWGTKSGSTSGTTGERYLPKRAREHLSEAEYKRTTEKMRSDTAKGKQFSAQPRDLAAKTAQDRNTEMTLMWNRWRSTLFSRYPNVIAIGPGRIDQSRPSSSRRWA